MKLYAVQVDRDETVSLVSVDATETPTGFEIELDYTGRAWDYRRRFHKEHDRHLIHLTPRAALEAFLESHGQARDQASRLLDAVQQLLLDAACEEQASGLPQGD